MRRSWDSGTPEQRAAVDALTRKLSETTLVRGRPDGSAEVVGVKERVGYRYSVTPEGVATLIQRDDSRVHGGRRAWTLLIVGLLIFIATAGAVSDRYGDTLPPWPTAIVFAVPAVIACVLMAAGLMGFVTPHDFVRRGERWEKVGPGWAPD